MLSEHLQHFLFPSEKDIAYAHRAYRRMVIIASVPCFFILIGFIANILGFRSINLIFSLLFNVIFIFFNIKPNKDVIASGIQRLLGSLGSAENRTYFQNYFLTFYSRIVGHILFYGVYILFYLGTNSFSEKPSAFAPILLCVIMLETMSIAWGYGQRLYKKFIKVSLPLMIIISFTVLIPSQTWERSLGFNPRSYFEVSAEEKALYEIQKRRIEKEEEEKVIRLKAITKKLKQGKPMTEEERKYLQKLEEEAKRNSVFGRLKRFITQRD